MLNAVACMTGVALGALLVLSAYSPNFLRVLAVRLIARAEALDAYNRQRSESAWYWLDRLGVEPRRAKPAPVEATQ